MCGIVGYIGYKDAYPILLKGLKRLEYRGYDSAGVALLNGETSIFKKMHRVYNKTCEALAWGRKDCLSYLTEYSFSTSSIVYLLILA